MKIFKKYIENTFLFAPRLSFIVLVLLLASIFFNGCTTVIEKEKVVTAIDTVEVPKIVPCNVDNLTCSFKGDYYLPTYYLLDCLRAHKRIIKICAGKDKELPSNATPEQIKAYIEKEVPSVKMDIK